MKWLISFLLGLLLLAFIIYAVPSFHQQAIKILSYSACDTPVLYKLGTVDPKFDLTQETVLSNLQTSTQIWNNAEGKTLFSYSQKAPLTVNFIYDKRTALDSSIRTLQNQLDGKNTTLHQKINTYEAQVKAFEQKLADFNANVEAYNRKGGAPPDVYKDLQNQQEALEQEGDALNTKARELNLEAHNYNGQVSVLNQDVGKLNNAIVQKPEEGLYDGRNSTITIYFANNHSELIHTLAHEFGHALGVLHVTDPKAIMYPLTSESTTLTAQDIDQLTFVCRQQSLPVLWIFQFRKTLHSFLGPLLQKQTPSVIPTN